jgi:hypothetical protein
MTLRLMAIYVAFSGCLSARHVERVGRVPRANAPGSSPRAAVCIRTCFRTYAQAQSVVKPEVHFETSLCVIFLPRLFHLQIFLSKYIFWS